MKSRHFIAAALLILAVAGILRGIWLTADPPVRRSVGIVWHDEGAWVHNARNQALWGTWRTDGWNPVFVAPVFTAFEYVSFAALGVGTWQARVVPAVSGWVAVVALMIGLQAVAGRRAALLGGALLATNYAFVMWNRAALMESTMTAWIVIAWMAWALADRRPWWGVVAGMATVAAFFTKAAAAFFVAALTLEVATMAVRAWRTSTVERQQRLRQVVWTMAGLAAASGIVAALFVLPHWSDYQFYNWQMSVTRKPAYTLGAFVDRATWLPIVQGIFSRMAIELVAGLLCMFTLVLRWPTARPAERLLVLWILVGLAELVAHDSGNERRYVMFIPALVALASLMLAAPAQAVPTTHPPDRRIRLAAVVLLPLVLYLIAGSLLRSLLIDDIEAGSLRLAVRLSAGAAVLGTLVGVWQWKRLSQWATTCVAPAGVAIVLTIVALSWHIGQFVDWAHVRSTFNHDASVALGRMLPDGTLVQGKLANGLSLENGIRPLFVGNHFGNYDDRLQRDDVRYILTYDLPRIGYESSDGSGLIQGILDHYPEWRVIASFDVDETRDQDRAVLVDKFPQPPAHARD